MKKPRFTIVTATAGAEKALDCIHSWGDHRAVTDTALVCVCQKTGLVGRMVESVNVIATTLDYLGPVPAFKLGVDLALQITAPDGVIACLHDDLLIEEDQWDAKVMAYFNQHPEVGLLGFGGGTGLGSDDIYKVPYSPMQLARQDFVSNMRDAEAHGRRVTVPTRVACLDGFSQIGRCAYWRGDYTRGSKILHHQAPLRLLEEKGVIHHAYDSFLGAYADQIGWQVYMLPIACHHFGGQTAVGDAGYQAWANQQQPSGVATWNQIGQIGGDPWFWQDAHRQVYDLLRGVLPLRF
jgi:hypothetical protein